MTNNPLIELEKLGQSIWLDYIKRDMFQNGLLNKLINEDGLRGMTSNPDIFEKSITKSHDYDNEIQTLIKDKKDTLQIYRTLTKNDVRSAADAFRPVFESTNKLDGYVSLEVNPHLAYDSEGTIKEAHTLWKEVDRPNIFIKIPATKQGLLAIQQLISEGININVTLLFGLERYKEVMEAYLTGIESRIKQNQSVENIISVASFFLSRIDVLIDPLLEKIINQN
ncbi:MAG: transaldolase, partial [Gammaproteobacteria bacterium]|nr:transaldolase [Gammaproteobacteria bacterium]